MFYRIENSLKADQIVQNGRGRALRIPGGGGVANVEINDTQKTRYEKIPGLTVHAQESFETSRRPPERRVAAEVETPKTETPKETRVAEPRSKRAAALLASYQSDETPRMEYSTFVVQAKEIIGADWPGGTPKKSRVLDLLQVVADED